MVRLLVVLLGFLLLPLLEPPPPRAASGADAHRVSESPGREALQVVGFELAPALSDLVWLEMVQRIGASRRVKEEVVEATAALSTWATDLDPRHFLAYYAPATIASSYAGLVDVSDALAERGFDQLPHRHQFPFLLGWNDYFVRGDALAASEHWLEASRIEGAPRYLASLAGRARRQAQGPEEALRTLDALIRQLPPGPSRQLAEERAKIIRSEPILEAYDAACQRYYALEGEAPPSAATLMLRGLAQVPPVDLLGHPIELDLERDADFELPAVGTATTGFYCRARTAVIRLREDEAIHKNLGSFEKDRRRRPDE